MYGLRLETGAVATNTPLSPWLLAFALFFFTSLAFAKRYVELRQLEAAGAAETSGRGYRVADASLIESLGPASGYVAVLVLALYMNSDQMHAIYGDGRLLWLLCPLVLYWITRVWLLAKRGELDDDPVVFALRDKTSLVVALLAAALIAAATIAARGGAG
jgi:4-hydroxybenzoate polyprenyltransferase